MKKQPVKKQHEVPPERALCGRLGKGKPGRRLRKQKPAGQSMKVWARTTAEGMAWLARKRGA